MLRLAKGAPYLIAVLATLLQLAVAIYDGHVGQVGTEARFLANASAATGPSFATRVRNCAAAVVRAVAKPMTGASSGLSAEAVTIMRRYAVSYQGSQFSSLDAASRVLSEEAMMTLTGCVCIGHEFDWNFNWGHRPAKRECNCMNNAVHEPCGKPLLGKPRQLAPEQYTASASQVDETKDSCGWSTYYLNRFLDNTPFSVARYNDGEWLAMELGSSGSGSSICPGNLDGLPCNDKFARRLRETLDNPALLASTWPANGAHDVANFYDKDFIFQSSWDFTRHDSFQGAEAWKFKQQFYLNDMIHGLVRDNPADLTAWMLVLGDKSRYKVTGVGPHWLGAMKGKIPFDDYIEISPEMKNGEEELKTVDRLEQEIGKRLDLDVAPPASGKGAFIEGRKLNERRATTQVFLISASMMSNVVIADLFPRAKAKGAYLIDIGSGFDPLINDAGVHRRTGTQAQTLYRDPSEKEVKRLAMLLHKISDHYATAGLGKPPFLEKPLAEIPAAKQLELARGLITKWVQ